MFQLVRQDIVSINFDKCFEICLHIRARRCWWWWLVGRSCQTLCNPMDYTAHQAPLSMGFSRQEYQSGLTRPPPGNLRNPGMELRSPTFHGDSLLSEPPGKPSRNFLPGGLADRLLCPQSPFIFSLDAPTSPHISDISSSMKLNLMIKNPDTGVRSGFKRGLCNSLTHSSTLAQKIPWMEEPGAAVPGVAVSWT